MVGKLDGYEVLAKTGAKVNGVDTTLPTTGVTLVLYQSNLPSAAGRGARFKMLIITLYSSHASAANGVTADESHDGGSNWDNVSTTSLAATTATKVYVKVSAPELRVRFANSANNTTTFRYSIVGDTGERGNG